MVDIWLGQQPILILLDYVASNIKFIAVARAMSRDVVASLTLSKTDSPEQYLTAVREVLAAPDFSNKVAAGSRCKLDGKVNSFNFTMDPEYRIYIAITALDYPERLTFTMIGELVTRFKKEFGTTSLTVPAGSLDGKAKKLFQTLVDEFDDPTKKDKVAQLNVLVENVKITMGKNIDGMITNMDSGRRIESQTIELQNSAEQFNKQATNLKRRELCKKWQTTGLIVIVVAVVIIIVVIAFVGVGGGTTTNPPTPSPTSPPSGS